MKIKEIIKILSTLDQDKDIQVACDEELNIIYNDMEICLLEDSDKYCLFPLSGSHEEY